MKLYNTLTRQTDDFQPIEAPVAKIYTCGPTVYDYLHVGNWFTYIREDILIRALKAGGYTPQWVMNITDVGHLVSDADDGEDKLEKGARREGKTAWEVAAFYTDYFMDGLSKLNISTPDQITKATDHIAEQIELVQQLEAKGYTYTISDGVYYDTAKFEGYAAFARLDLDEQQAGARVEYNREKRNPTDFALWKFSPKDQQRDMEWDSPWGKGFPGWHIECSAMSMKYLGATLDIHAGGIDHIPVHHTNEIAQSEAVTGRRFANYWLHANHITINGDKISKSLGNGITLEDIADKGIDLMAFRLHVLESHYRSQSKFSWDSLEAAQNRLNNWLTAAELRWQHSGQAVVDYAAYRQYLQDDLNTPQALAQIDGVLTAVTNQLPADTSAYVSFLETIETDLGIELLKSTGDIDDAAKQLVREREAARQSKDWAESDRLRDQLLGHGLLVRDTPAGTTWSRRR